MKYYPYLDKFVNKFTQHIIAEYESLTASMDEFKSQIEEDYE